MCSGDAQKLPPEKKNGSPPFPQGANNCLWPQKPGFPKKPKHTFCLGSQKQLTVAPGPTVSPCLRETFKAKAPKFRPKTKWLPRSQAPLFWSKATLREPKSSADPKKNPLPGRTESGLRRQVSPNRALQGTANTDAIWPRPCSASAEQMVQNAAAPHVGGLWAPRYSHYHRKSV